MARIDPQQGLMPSFLDRLLDEKSVGSDFRPGYSVDDLMRVVIRDLDDLLNTQPSYPDPPPGLPEEELAHYYVLPEGLLRESLVNYGLPDLGPLAGKTGVEFDQISMLIKQTINRFEPRLQDVEVTAVEVKEGTHGKINFRVRAKLRADPVNVGFEKNLEVNDGRIRVEQPGS